MRSNLTRFIATALAILCSTKVIHADNPINPGFPYGSTKVRGVNLGGWLVLEVCTGSPYFLDDESSILLLSAVDHSFVVRADR